MGPRGPWYWHFLPLGLPLPGLPWLDDESGFESMANTIEEGFECTEGLSRAGVLAAASMEDYIRTHARTHARTHVHARA